MIGFGAISLFKLICQGRGGRGYYFCCKLFLKPNKSNNRALYIEGFSKNAKECEKRSYKRGNDLFFLFYVSCNLSRKSLYRK